MGWIDGLITIKQKRKTSPGMESMFGLSKGFSLGINSPWFIPFINYICIHSLCVYHQQLYMIKVNNHDLLFHDQCSWSILLVNILYCTLLMIHLSCFCLTYFPKCRLNYRIEVCFQVAPRMYLKQWCWNPKIWCLMIMFPIIIGQTCLENSRVFKLVCHEIVGWHPFLHCFLAGDIFFIAG